ncbi:hypothetical protein BJX64DRAFT_281786 [Aspergillus heterothallicus]
MAKDDLSETVIVTTAVLLVIPCLVVLLRCYVRAYIVKALGWDDGFMILALVAYIAYCACIFGTTFSGFGKKMATLTAEQRAAAMKYLWSCQFGYLIASSFCRVSVCIFLFRLTVKIAHIRIIWIIIIIAVGTGIFSLIVILTQCIPISYIWLRMLQDPSIPVGKCRDGFVVHMTYVYSAFMGFTDIALGILPSIIVWNLQMKRQAKSAIAGILGMAGLASAAVITRAFFGYAYLDFELFYKTVPYVIWSTVELSVGITAGSLATLGPLLRHFRCCNTGSDDVSSMPTPQPRVFRRPRGMRDLSYPLSTFDSAVLRADKLSTIVTEVQIRDSLSAQRRNQRTNHSREHLTVDGSRVESRGTDAGDVGLEIYRTLDVTQTSDAGSAIVHERV